MTVFSSAVVMVLTLAFSWASSHLDFLFIVRGREIDHVKAWLFRAVVVVGLCTLAGQPLLAVPCAMLFSASFRESLNRIRDDDPRYIAPWSNVYDRVFFAAYLRRWPSQQQLEDHKKLYHKWGVTDHVHSAGVLVYVFEALVFLSSLLILYACSLLTL